MVILGFRRLEIITSISATVGFTGCAGIIFASLRARGKAECFSLDRWKVPIRLAALGWTIVVVLALAIPEADSSPDAIPHLAAKSTLAVGAVGLA